VEFAVDLDRGLHRGKMPVSYLSPVIDVFQFKNALGLTVFVCCVSEIICYFSVLCG